MNTPFKHKRANMFGAMTKNSESSYRKSFQEHQALYNALHRVSC